MKTIFNQALNLNLNSKHTKAINTSILVVTFVSAMLFSTTVKSQSFVTNYYGLDLNPRDIAHYPAKNQMIISSMKNGQIGYVNTEGKYTMLLKDSMLISATSVKVKGNFLYVLNGDSGESENSSEATKWKLANLIKVDLLTNTITSVYELDKLYNGPHFLNDLTIDNNGTMYITDALSRVIYKVEPNGTASVLVTSGVLGKEGQELKAIAYHKNGYLLVAVNNDIFKVDLVNNNTISKVFVDEYFQDIQSLNFTANHLLVLSEGGDHNQVHILNSNNSWRSANLLRTDNWNYNNPSNTEFVRNKIYVLDSKPQSLSDNVTLPDNVTPPVFSVRVIDLKKYPIKKNKRKGTITSGVMQQGEW